MTYRTYGKKKGLNDRQVETSSDRGRERENEEEFQFKIFDGLE